MLNFQKLFSNLLLLPEREGRVCSSNQRVASDPPHLHNLKNVKMTHEGVLLLVKLQAEVLSITFCWQAGKSSRNLVPFV